MRVELFSFQKRALADIRMKTAEAMGSYHRTHAPQVVSFTAPTGAGKTIIMSALIEGRIVKLSATPLRNRPHMVFCSQGTFWGAGSTHGISVGCNPLVYP